MSLRKRAAAALTALATAGAAVLLAGTAGQASAAAAVSWPAHVFAPYADTWTNNITLSDIASSYGTKYFTIAFVDGSNCQWNIGEQSTIQSQIAALRAQGGDVAVSFGGYTTDTDLTELGDACPSPEAAAAQIESVVTTFGVTHLDFDIESNSLTNSAGITRRNQALAEVRSWANGNGTPLSISFTIPALPTGLTQDGLNVLDNAVANGFTPDIVNGMAMDYATSGTETGTAADQAVDALASQVASAFGISASAAYGRIGVTPMIGQNDSAGEIFTLADASNLESYAAAKGVALISYWDENRDNGGCPGQTSASGSCSGLSQNTGDFANAFQPFTSGASAGAN
jgi:Glycosyl hydrolases family 18